MAILRGIRLEHTGKGALSVRAWRKVMKAVFLAVGQAWKNKMLPRHWDRDAHSRYGYQTRTVGWIRRKLALMKRGEAAAGAGNDLMFKGQMKEWVLSTVQVKATSGSARVAAGGPDYLKINFLPPRPNMIAEISALTEEERAELTQIGEDALWEAWDQMPVQTEKTDVSVAGFFHGSDRSN